MNELKRQNITVYEHTQHPGDIILTKGFHQGGNLGYNLNIAVNAAIEGEEWTYTCVEEAEKTSCDSQCKHDDKAFSLTNLAPKFAECRECGKTFDSDSGKRKHDEEKHGGPRKSQCRFCKDYIMKIIDHIRDTHKKELPNVRCKLCLKLFPDIWAFNKHWTKKEVVDKWYKKCNFCDQKFRLKNDAMNHKCLKKGF